MDLSSWMAKPRLSKYCGSSYSSQFRTITVSRDRSKVNEPMKNTVINLKERQRQRQRVWGRPMRPRHRSRNRVFTCRVKTQVLGLNQ